MGYWPLKAWKGILMWLHASCFLDFNIPVPTPFLLMLRPRSGWQQWVAREKYGFIAQRASSRISLICSATCVSDWSHPAGYFFRSNIRLDIETADASDTAPGPPLSKCSNYPMKPCLFSIQAGIVNRIVSPKWPRPSWRAGHRAMINAQPSLIIFGIRYGTRLEVASI